jgi:signal transduction histidine kinase
VIGQALAAARRDRPVQKASAAAPSGATRSRILRVVTVVAPLAFLALLDFVRHAFFGSALHTPAGALLIGLVLLVAASLFSEAVFRTLDRLQHTIVRQSERVAALEEHDRMAREINDGFLQRIYGVGLSLHGALLAAEDLPAQTAEQIEHAVEELDRAIEEMRGYLLASERTSGGGDAANGAGARAALTHHGR